LAPHRAKAAITLWQISPGTTAAPDAQYAILMMSNVCSLDGIAIATEDSAGLPEGAFIRLSGAPPLRDGLLYLATPAAEALYNFPADQVASCAGLPVDSGRVCIFSEAGQGDCVAFGQFLGDNGNFGAPAVGVQLDQVLSRVATTGNNLSDWARGGNSDPTLPLNARVLPANPVICDQDGGTGSSDAGLDAGADGGSDASVDAAYLNYPDGGQCPLNTSDAGPGGSDAGGGVDRVTTGGGGGGGGGSWPQNSSSGSCCQGSVSNAALFMLPLFFSSAWRRRRKAT